MSGDPFEKLTATQQKEADYFIDRLLEIMIRQIEEGSEQQSESETKSK